MSDIPEPARPARSTRNSILLAAGFLGVTLLLSFTKHLGLLDQEVVNRAVMAMIGLGLAAYGNTMPKLREGAQPTTLGTIALRQAVQRVGGWSMTLGGLGFAGFWVFAPIAIAKTGAVAVMLAAVAVMIGFVAWRVWLFNRASPKT